jgi:hypothetical protein
MPDYGHIAATGGAEHEHKYADDAEDTPRAAAIAEANGAP